MTVKANAPEIVLSANKVSVYVALTNESIILTAANIIKKDILQFVVKKQNGYGHQLLNNFQHLKEI